MVASSVVQVGMARPAAVYLTNTSPRTRPVEIELHQLSLNSTAAVFIRYSMGHSVAQEAKATP